MSRSPTSAPRSPRKGRPSAVRGSAWLRWFWRLAIAGTLALVALLIYLDARVQERFSGQRWAVPAKVYARPLELFAGQRLGRDDFLTELEALGYRRVARVQRPGDVAVNGQQVVLHSRGFQFHDGSETAQVLRVSFAGQQVRALTSGEGVSVPVARIEPLLIGGIYPAHNEDRILVQLDEVPPLLVETLLAVEDRDFYNHFGVSPRSILRALVANLSAGGVVQGGSTLTQQLVKNFFLSSERSLTRKGAEALMAILLELRYDKREILEAYLNEVFLGQDGQRAIHGFGLASQYFFAQPLAELRPEQIALLVGMVKGPSYYNPRRSPERALERRNLVLDLLGEQGVLSAQAQALARKAPLGVSARGSLANSSYPAFLDLVKRQLRQDYREEDLTGEGLRVFTSFDPILQLKAESALADTLRRLGNRRGVEDIEMAMVVTQPQTGEIQALLGSRQPRFAGFNRALDAQRPIGSLVKPAIYLAALEQPTRYTLTSLLADEPLAIRGGDGQVWEPKNFDRRAHGTVFLYQALANSYNLSTARLGMEVGVEKVLDTVRRLGGEQTWPAYPSMLLGAGALSPLQVATMYQTIANGGFNTPLRGIRSVLAANGEPLKGYPYEVQQRFDPGAVHLLQHALQRAMREGTGRSVYSQLPGSLVVAGKTGTSNDSRDSWFAGFSQDLLAVVWMGRDDNGATPLTGATGALQLWTGFMRRAQPVSLDLALPDNVQLALIDPYSGEGREAGCPGAVQMPYIRGSEPPVVPCGGVVPDEDPLRDWLQQWLE